VHVYEVGVGDSPARIAHRFTGNPYRYGELLAANAHKPLVYVSGAPTFAALGVGEQLALPDGFLGEACDRGVLPGEVGLALALGDAFGVSGYGDDLAAVGLHPDNPDGMYAALTQFLQNPQAYKQAQKNWHGARDNLAWYDDHGTAVLAWPFHSGKWFDAAPKTDQQVRAIFKIPAGTATADFLRAAYGHGSSGQFPAGGQWRLGVEQWKNPNLFADIVKTATAPERLAMHAAEKGLSATEKLALQQIKQAVGTVKTLAVDVKDPAKFARDLVKIAKDAAKIEKFVLQQAEGIVSLVPGLGTAVSTAIAAGLAVLEGGNPLDMAIKIAYGAIPIPPGIRSFTDIVLQAVLDILDAFLKSGTNLDKVLSRLLAEELTKILPDDIKKAGTDVIAALAPTVLQALTGKLPSPTAAAAAAAQAAGLPASLPAAAQAAAQATGLPTSLPAVAQAAGLPAALPTSLPAAAQAAGLPTSLPAALPTVPGVTGVGDKASDFVALLQSQYAALNLTADVKKQIDPIVHALTSMIRSMDMAPAILLAVRSGIGSQLPAGAIRDLGMRVFDTLAHLLLGKLFKGRPTQAKVTASGAVPIAHTAAAYRPLARAEQRLAQGAYHPYRFGVHGVGDGALDGGPFTDNCAENCDGVLAGCADGALDKGGHGGGGGGHGGGHWGGGSGWHGGGGGWSGGWRRPFVIRGPSGYGPWWWGSNWWAPWAYEPVAIETVTCTTWGDTVQMSPAMESIGQVQLRNSGGNPAAVRGADGITYQFAYENDQLTMRPCAQMSSTLGDGHDKLYYLFQAPPGGTWTPVKDDWLSVADAAAEMGHIIAQDTTALIHVAAYVADGQTTRWQPILSY
jgi:uncharacterized membrane protein YgcG